MQIEKLQTWQEWVEVDKVIDTAFLHNMSDKEEERKAEAEGTKERREVTWGLKNDTGKIVSGIITTRHTLSFDGALIPCGELNMVASLPEVRGNGNVRALVREVLRDMIARGDLFATLHPFSFRFYRQFSFEMLKSEMTQRIPVEEFSGFSCGYSVKRVDSDADTAELKALYDAFMLERNLMEALPDRNWAYRGNGEYGEPFNWPGARQTYTYLFADENGKSHAYLKFSFEPNPQNFMVGTMQVNDLVYDSPEALHNVLGFVYGMRAKVSVLELHGGPDFTLMAPECSKVERTLHCSSMLRVLNVEKILQMMRQPTGEGSYSIRVVDAFLPENTGTYAVCYQDGRTEFVAKSDASADIEMTVETLGQAAIGTIDLREMTYRAGTKLNGNLPVLRSVFVKKL